MSLWKRGNVWWCGFIARGERVQQSTGTSNRREAELVYHKLRVEYQEKPLAVSKADPTMTVEVLVALFLTSGAARPHHKERLKFLLPFFGDIRVLDLTRGLADDYRRVRKREKPVSDATVNRDLSTLRHILYWAVDHGVLQSNPLARVRMVAEPLKFRKIVSPGEEQRLLAAAPPHLAAMITAAVDTGMRRGEITNQRWEDIDLERRLIHVTKSKTISGQHREIPMTTRVHALLAAQAKQEGFVFTFRGEQVHLVKTAWKHTLRRAQLRHFRFHDLRHTFNTRLMEAGIVPDVRMALMGHSSGNRVHSAYTHVELPAKRRAIAQLEAWLKEESNNDVQQGGRRDGDQENA